MDIGAFGQISKPKYGSKYQGPIKYKDTEIAQWHNPKLFLEGLFNENRNKRFTSILNIGAMGSGKSTVRRFIEHHAHEKKGYYVVNFTADDMPHLDERLADLPLNRDLFMAFEDVSLVFKLMSGERKNRALATITTARHPNLGNTRDSKIKAPDRRIMIVSEIHYIPAMEKMMRSFSSWRFYSDMSEEEEGIFNHATRGKYQTKVDTYRKLVLNQFRKSEFTVSLTASQNKTYEIDKPFRLVMCYDTARVRFFLVPREDCSLCNADYEAQPNATAEELIKLMESYDPKHATQALKTVLAVKNYSDQYPRDLARTIEVAKHAMASVRVPPEALAMALRKKSKYTGKPYKHSRLKKRDYMADLARIRAESNTPHNMPVAPASFGPSKSDTF